ncbi:MAG: citrate synthase [Desulfobacterium sp.]|nr:citrate synthase [Desulfobacterium sp.]
MKNSPQTIQLLWKGQCFDFPLVQGSEGETAIDIKTLRQRTGLITLDQGYANTGSCTSSITFMDGERGILRYRGIPIQELARGASFKETAFLLIYGTLPTPGELVRFSEQLTDYSPVHENMRLFFQNFPPNAHPMGILSSMVNSLRSFYPELANADEEIQVTVPRLLSKIRTLAAMSYRISMGYQVVYPRPDLSYCANFLHMMFDSTVKPYELKEEVVQALRTIWILHADHEQNCSTSAVRLVGSARVNLYAAISSGITALWGPLHGGANQAVIDMLEGIRNNGGNVDTFVKRAKDRTDPFRLMGFGHRVYKTYDPRARIMKGVCHRLLQALDREDPLLDIAQELEKTALSDDYFISRNLYPNIDFYTGIAFRAMGIPTNMFPVMFAIGRLPGWIAQWLESIKDPHWKLNRPRQIYVGPGKTMYRPPTKGLDMEQYS